MKLLRVRAIARKEFLHIIRDWRSLVMAIAIPVTMLILFGFALTLDVDNVPLVIWDQSNTPASRLYVSEFTASHYFSVAGYATTYREIERAIDSGKALAALVIPYDFAERRESQASAPVQFIVDGSDSNTATIALGYADAITQTFSQQMILQQVRREGVQNLRIPLDVRARVWFNTDLQSRNYIVPGLIGVIMMIIAAMLTSLTIAREKERGTMEQLISTPVKGPELILGKLIPYFCVGLFDVLLAVLMGRFLLDVPMRGSYLLLFAMASVFLAGTLALGILVSILSRTQLMAAQLAMVLTFLPSFLFSGFMFPITSIPEPLRKLTYIVPARYFIALSKSIYLKGVGLSVLGGEAILLVTFAAVMVTVAILTFKKKLT